MKMSCENACSLVPSYLDGELSEEQAKPLRAHLLDCPACREPVKEEKALKRWFRAARDEPVVVPVGFAARVARRAFAGDPGVLTPLSSSPSSTGVVARRESLLPFLLGFSALAAGLLFVLSLLIQRQSLPAGSGLQARQLEQAPWEGEHGPAPSAETPDEPDEPDASGANTANGASVPKRGEGAGG